MVAQSRVKAVQGRNFRRGRSCKERMSGGEEEEKNENMKG